MIGHALFIERRADLLYRGGMQDIVLKFKTRHCTEVFEQWCVKNGVVRHPVEAMSCQVFDEMFDGKSMIGYYRISDEDYPLVALRWSGVVISCHELDS